MKLSAAMARRLSAVVHKDTVRFVELVHAAGLDRAKSFQGADLRGVDFLDDDLDGFDFARADIRGADLSRAQNLRPEMFAGAITDETTRGPVWLRVFPPRTHLTRWRDPIPGLPQAACPEMITLNPAPPDNTFLMGAPKEEEGSEENERPQRLVTVAPFALGRCAVTFAQWDAANAAGAGLVVLQDAPWGRGQHPVFQVTWNDAQAYCAWLNQRLGIAGAYRLPSEAEWEYACRAGTTTPFSFGETIRTEQANYRESPTYGSGPEGEFRWRTVPVGSLPPNPWGLHEMHGNVLEWVEDEFAAYPGWPTDASPLPVSGIGMRGLRGGGWGDGPQYIRSARRTGRSPGGGREGFRIARTLF